MWFMALRSCFMIWDTSYCGDKFLEGLNFEGIYIKDDMRYLRIFSNISIGYNS
jgi:hypothetical protein